MSRRRRFQLAEPIVVGWREHVALPGLGIDRIDCKIDTGARTSSLHAFAIETYEKADHDRVRFGVHPVRRDDESEVWCDARVLGERAVTNSGGFRETRIVIRTNLHLGRHAWPIELNLTDRSTMGYRMLLGRTAMHHRVWVDPSASFRQGLPADPEEDEA